MKSSKELVEKAALLYIENKKLLIVYESAINKWITLGGTVEPGESYLEALDRECLEEACVSTKNPIFFKTYEGGYTERGNPLRIISYLGEIEGRPKVNPDDTVTQITWVGRDIDFDLVLSPQLEYRIIPDLIKKKLL